jgi:hypothetical protein
MQFSLKISNSTNFCVECAPNLFVITAMRHLRMLN